jgi:hypothetical protein
MRRDTWRVTAGTTTAPGRSTHREDVERTVAALRSAWGATAFNQLWQVGRALPLDKIIAEALVPVDPPRTHQPCTTRPGPLTRRERAEDFVFRPEIVFAVGYRP